MSCQKIFYLPFLYRDIVENTLSFEEREGFSFIGNFLHAPNVDAVRSLKNQLWDPIRTHLPKAKLHIYGGYATQEILQMNNPKKGFYVHGRAEDARKVISKSKILLCPLRYGAGLKGKIFDAMFTDTPIAGSSIAWEGISSKENCPGIYFEGVQHLPALIHLYRDQSSWEAAQKNIPSTLAQFDAKTHIKRLEEHISDLIIYIEESRSKDYLQMVFWHQNQRSTEFMSRWIHEKNKQALKS